MRTRRLQHTPNGARTRHPGLLRRDVPTTLSVHAVVTSQLPAALS